MALCNVVVVVVTIIIIIIIIVIITEKFIRQLEWHLLLAITEKQEAQQSHRDGAIFANSFKIIQGHWK